MTQRTAARVAGALYLSVLVCALLTEFFLRGPLLVAGDAARTAQNILAAEAKFRLSIVTNLLIVSANVVLIGALYVVLNAVNRHVAILAVLFRLVECAAFALTALNDFVTLRLLSGVDYLNAYSPEQLQALARFFVGLRHAGGLIGSVYLGFGSAVFAWLWWKSRYIPRALSAWGIFASLVLALGILAMMALPDLTPIIGPAYWAPVFLFDLTLGIWLLTKSIRT